MVSVDEIAKGTGCKPDDPLRIARVLDYTLDLAVARGDLYLEQHELRSEAYQLLNKSYDTEAVNKIQIYKGLIQMVQKGKLINQNQNIYQPFLAAAEDETARAIANMIGEKNDYHFDVEQEIEISQKKLGFNLSPEQKQAVITCFFNQISIITGGPGTGKTTILKLILDIYLKFEENVLLVAPTGRASRRMAEATGYPNARTLHRALGLVSDEDYLNDSSILNEKFIIVDEMSMVDMRLAKELFTRLQPDTHLLIVGDPDQLPSVGPGNVLRELLAVKDMPVTRLQSVFRQKGASRIVLNAHEINNGSHNLQFGHDFEFIDAQDDIEAATAVKDYYLKEIRSSSVNDVQILSPVRERGDSSANKLNALLHDLVNHPEPGKKELKIGTLCFREGDRIMQIQNKDEISNGDIGIIKNLIDDEEFGKGLMIEFSGNRNVTYFAKDLGLIRLAYAMTIHKSQGSQYPTVIIPLLKSHYMMLQRNLIYTAITRAEQKVILVGQKQALHTAINRQLSHKRNTKLSAKINLYAPKYAEPEYKQTKIS